MNRSLLVSLVMLYEVLKRLGGIDLKGIEAILLQFLHREAGVRSPSDRFHHQYLQVVLFLKLLLFVPAV